MIRPLDRIRSANGNEIVSQEFGHKYNNDDDVVVVVLVDDDLQDC